MLSKNKIKYINSLKIKKYRSVHNQFIAEGNKIVRELISQNYPVDQIYCTEEWNNSVKNSLNNITICTQSELKKISTVTTPQQVIAILNIPQAEIDYDLVSTELVLMLDNIQDPGNLGTIMRIADWFGIKNIICSGESVDVYNPKVIQASMGAFTRVSVHYTDLTIALSEIKDRHEVPVYGTFLEGENIYNEPLSKNGIIIMGNEGKGISEKLEKFINRKIFIPNYPANAETSESLNISVATAITCSEFRRRL